ncbi:heme ABC transporter ATP-binding protein [Thiocapsa imhoffii]|uniref:Heme ABC transporter ATP-binding protein n=1 Tax=Thiocapsa imhoffii TaxID=382777 RepID=A0A9X0WFU7_9GAMM|nr:heme ABC transporter ATP-binding protein [Thiocapsa imhoffii]MBK1643524.1 heme ABC transporter ATP-binding protein [Thiocapsa imhoffii]
MLKAEKIGFRIAQHRLLEDVGCVVGPGEFVVVLGPNGAGKSTLLRVLSGDLTPTTGAVSLNGRRLRNWSPPVLARQRAVLPQQSALSFPFLVEDVVRMGRSPHRAVARERQETIVQEAMRRADVWHLAGRLYPSLSGGERQRVQLARVLAQIWDPTDLGPRYLLLDEPTSALDIAHQHQLLAIAREMLSGGELGVLAILHDLNLASAYADRILLLKNGRLVAAGPVAEIMNCADLAAVFGIPVQTIAHPQLAGRHLVITGHHVSDARPSS